MDDPFYDENYTSEDDTSEGDDIMERFLGPLILKSMHRFRSNGGPSGKGQKTESETESIRRHILATRLVDILSVTIHHTVNDKTTMCEIYGDIRVIDIQQGGGEIFTLFHKDKDNPEYIKLGEPLLLTPSAPVPNIAPSDDTILDVHLFDRKANNMVIAKNNIVLNKTSDECEEVHVIEVYGEDKRNFARIHYAIFQYAVSATVDVLFFSQDHKFDLLCSDGPSIEREMLGKVDTIEREMRGKVDTINYDSKDCEGSIVTDIYGSVTVRSNVNNGKGDYHSVSLFSKSPEQGVSVKSGGFIQLSRSVVAVPAYASSLVIKVDLSHCQTMKTIASGSLEFKPNDWNTFKKDLVGAEGRVRVRVTWSNASDEKPYIRCEQKQKCLISKRKDTMTPNQVLEVFSVDIHKNDFKPFSFYGTINVSNSERLQLFSKDKSCPQVCRESGALAVLQTFDSRDVTLLSCFSLSLDLKDAATGAQISRGLASWEDSQSRKYFDMRLCSVIQGEQGFAAVHYTFFSDGISAIVDVTLNGKHLPGYVYGKIVARYNTYDYSTTYDKKYYQIVMFDRHSQDAPHKVQESGSVMPLLKPVICLPRSSLLNIEADLTVCPEPPIDCKLPQGATSLVQGSMELKPIPDDESHGRISFSACYMDVVVKWEYH